MLVDFVRAYKIPTVPAPTIEWQPVQVKAGSSTASTISLRAPQLRRAGASGLFNR
jgi:hypothetical protein